MTKDEYFVYLISAQKGNSNRTYIGCTNNIKRRIRQHNGEIKGGAKATSGLKGFWKYICIIGGFPDRKNALQFEWKCHHPPLTGKYGIQGRLLNIKAILATQKWTSNSVPVDLSTLNVTWYTNDINIITELHPLLKIYSFDNPK